MSAGRWLPTTAEPDRSGGGGGRSAHGGELLFGGGDCHLESFDFAEPPLIASLGEAGVEVLEDLLEATRLGRVRAEERAAEAGVFVFARGAVGPAADPEFDLASLEMPEELFPFGIGRFST